MRTNYLRLRVYIACHSAELQQRIKLYVIRAGLAYGDAADQTAQEILSEMTAEALTHAERFDSARHPASWLMGIAANLIKRRVRGRSQDDQREPLVRDLHPQIELSDDELFDFVAGHSVGSPRQLESDQFVAALLAELSDTEREIIELAVLHDMDSTMLAAELNIKPGTARMRLHRALQRLRIIYKLQNDVRRSI